MKTKFTFGKIFFGIVILLFGGFLWATLKPSQEAGSALDRVSETAKETVGKIGDSATGLKDKTVAIVDEAAKKSSDMAGKVVDKAGDMAGKVADTAGDMADKAAETAGDAYKTAGDMAEKTMDKAGDMAGKATDKVRDAYQGAGNMAEKTMGKTVGMAGGEADKADAAYTTAEGRTNTNEPSQASGDSMEKVASAPMPMPPVEVSVSDSTDQAKTTMASTDNMMRKAGESMAGEKTGERVVEVPAKYQMKGSGDAMRPALTDVGTWRYEEIRFDHNQWDLKPSTFSSLDKLTALMNAQPELNIEIHGHSDSSGPREYNMDLSHRRAESVKTYLESQGIASSRMTTKAYGPDRPLSVTSNEGTYSENRRIEIKPLN